MKYRKKFPRVALWLLDESLAGDTARISQWLSATRRSIYVKAGEGTPRGPLELALTREELPATAIGYYVEEIDPESLITSTQFEKIRRQMIAHTDWAECMGTEAIVYCAKMPDVATSESSDAATVARLLHYVRPSTRLHPGLIRCDFATGWDLWRAICSICPHVRLALIMSSDYGSIDDEKFRKLTDRWRAEEVSMVICGLASIRLNSAGQPSMAARNREIVVRHCIDRGAMLCFEIDSLCDDTKVDDSGLTAPTLPSGWELVDSLMKWLEYVHCNHGEVSEQEAYSLVYQDVLQEPLQPLAENLSRHTYSVFEGDSEKYRLYKQAITKVLLPLIEGASRAIDATESKAESAAERADDDVSLLPLAYVHIALLGGGRGPLLEKVFEVLDEAGWTWTRKGNKFKKDCNAVRLYFSYVDKNPAALILLRANMDRFPMQHWWRHVQLYQQDMRAWSSSLPVTLVISELLGSIGDNELAPECLQLRCATEGSILLPSKCVSYFVPVVSEKLYKLAAPDRQMGYVCHMSTYSPLSTTEAVAFEFDFQKTLKIGKLSDNDRFARLRWVNEHGDNWLHGFAGYFDAILSSDVTISTRPSAHSPGLQSWYPLFLPILTPIWSCVGDSIQLDIWRCSDLNKVWYEWVVSICRKGHARVVSALHNSHGAHWHMAK